MIKTLATLMRGYDKVLAYVAFDGQYARPPLPGIVNLGGYVSAAHTLPPFKVEAATLARLLTDKSPLRIESSNDKGRVRIDGIDVDCIALEGDELTGAPRLGGLVTNWTPDLAGMARVASCMAKLDIRYYLNGILLALSRGLMVATDGHRLARVETPAQEGVADAIMPRALVELALKSKATHAALHNEGMLIASGSAVFYARYVEGKFPDHDRVVPDPSKKPHAFTVDREDFLGALENARRASSERFRGVVLKSDGTIKAPGLNAGYTTRLTLAKALPEGITWGFNVDYLLALAKDAQGPTFTMLLSGEGESALMVDGPARYVVMPMRV